MFLIVLVALVAVAPSLSEMIERARVRAGVSHNHLAACQGISPAQWSRQQSENYPDQHPSVRRLRKTPALFQQFLWEEMLLAAGGERPVTAREVLDILRPLMAQFSVSQQQEERCA